MTDGIKLDDVDQEPVEDLDDEAYDDYDEDAFDDDLDAVPQG